MLLFLRTQFSFTGKGQRSAQEIPEEFVMKKTLLLIACLLELVLMVTVTEGKSTKAAKFAQRGRGRFPMGWGHRPEPAQAPKPNPPKGPGRGRFPHMTGR